MRQLLILSLCLSAWAQVASGPLRTSSANSRYFVDPNGKAVYLAGSHVWQNLQDNGLLMEGATSDPPPAFAYEAWLDQLAGYGHNFFRLWRWEVPKWTDGYFGAELKYCAPHPWLRTGTGLAADGKARFDLTRFDEAYFQRMRTRIELARRKGFYVSIMLFDGWAAQFSDAWTYHPFAPGNNSNGVEADAMGYYTAPKSGSRTTAGKRVWELQQAYIRKVIDTVNDLDNVLYEVVNESGPWSTEWQYQIIALIRDYERAKPKQHLVGMTFQFRGGSNDSLFESKADWISPNPGVNNVYKTSPPTENRGKVIVNDTDHLWGHSGGDAVWVWKSFLRGLNVLLMEDMTPSPTWQDGARLAMGQTVKLSRRMDLANMTPKGELSDTQFVLAAPGKEYAVLVTDQGLISVDLTAAAGRQCAAEWLDIGRNDWKAAAAVAGGTKRRFQAPLAGPAVLYLNCH
jgi:hypothetical protein